RCAGRALAGDWRLTGGLVGYPLRALRRGRPRGAPGGGGGRGRPPPPHPPPRGGPRPPRPGPRFAPAPAPPPARADPRPASPRDRPADLADRDRIAALRADLEMRGIRWLALRYHKRPRVPATSWDVFHGWARSVAAGLDAEVDLVHARTFVGGVLGRLVAPTL